MSHNAPCALFLVASLAIVACSSSASSPSPSDPTTPSSGASDGGGSSSGAEQGDGGTGSSTPAPTYTKVEIDFDDVADAKALASKYGKQVTFKVDGGEPAILNGADSYGGSAPHFLCPTGGCMADFGLTFLRPARKIRFSAVGVNNEGPIATLTAKDAAGATLLEKTLEGGGSLDKAVIVDLGALEGVVSLDVHDIEDSAGFGIDDLSFELRD